MKPLVVVVAALVVFVVAAAFVSGWNPLQQIAGSNNNDGSDGQEEKDVASAGDKVGVFYIGKLDDGTVFDTNDESFARSAGIYNAQRQYLPFEFTLGAGEVIPGFDKAVTGMKIGQTKTVIIPPAEAYGDQGPLAGKTLNFEIRLVSIG